MWRIYKTAATVSVVALVAFYIFQLFALTPRQLFFVLTLLVGVVLLISINRSRPRPDEVKKLSAGKVTLLEAQLPAVPSQPLPDTPPSLASTRPLDAPVKQKLSRTEARQWLDEFLQRQQTPD